jgi:hypothetical protein
MKQTKRRWRIFECSSAPPFKPVKPMKRTALSCLNDGKEDLAKTPNYEKKTL